MLKCKQCKKPTNFTFRGMCLECNEIEKTKPKFLKARPIPKNDGLNPGKNYLEYLKSSSWEYVKPFKQAYEAKHK